MSFHTFNTKEQTLSDFVIRASKKFPKFCDDRLKSGYHRLLGISSAHFITQRSSSFLRKLLLVQFFLQVKIEKALNDNSNTRHLFLRLVRHKPNRVSVAMTLSRFYKQENFDYESLLKTFNATALHGFSEVPESYYSWNHPELSYTYHYIEFQLIRGKVLSHKEIRNLENSLREKIIHSIPRIAPVVFWPYNEEELFKQLLTLQREMTTDQDIPHVSVHFRQQTSSFLEFVICLVCSKKNVDREADIHLPLSVTFKLLHHQSAHFIERWIFSLQIPSDSFFENGGINLLHARRRIIKHLEELLGDFRDFNGGLFEKRHKVFEEIKNQLCEKIPLFHIFAEKVFYAMTPLEKQISISIQEAEALFLTVSQAIRKKEDFFVQEHPDGFLTVKTYHPSVKEKIISKLKDNLIAQIELSGTFYISFQTKATLSDIKTLINESKHIGDKKQVLRLNFQDKEPFSVSPHSIVQDIRCRIVYNILYEGLMRLNQQSRPIPGEAKRFKYYEKTWTYIFFLRKAHWSDGTQVNALEYEKSWKRAFLSSYHPSYLVLRNAQAIQNGQKDISELGVTALNPEILEIKLEYPDPFFLKKLSTPLFFPQHGDATEVQCFNGPFLLQKRSKEKWIFDRNPYYWNQKKVSLAGIEISMIQDSDAIFMQYQNQKIDWFGDPFNTPTIEQKKLLAGALKKRPVLRYFWIYLNVNHPLLSSPLIRKALSTSIDREFITETLLMDNFPLHAPLPPHLSLCSEKKIVTLNIPYARELFEQGRRVLNLQTIPPLTILHCNVGGHMQTAIYLKKTWEQIFGLKIDIKELEWNSLRGNLEQNNYDIAGGVSSISYEDPLEPLERMEKLNFWNFSQWKCDAYSKLIQQARLTPDANKRLMLLQQAEEILIEEAPLIPIAYCVHTFVHNEQLKNYSMDQTGCVDFRESYLER